MKNDCVCSSCGRTMERVFLYCPWCGTSAHEESVNFQEENETDAQIKEMEEQLNKLEKELDILVLSTEMHK
jgi:predicted amidophosphoribosyltransferase